jgi:hypothetical protein
MDETKSPQSFRAEAIAELCLKPLLCALVAALSEPAVAFKPVAVALDFG